MEKMGEYIKVIWTHVSWNGMHHRCYNLKHTSYPDYGGRGIEVCDRWHDEEGFENFIKDVGLRSERALSIDRINVNGNYEPTNCRWSSIEQQANNRRDNHFIIVDGEKGTIAEMSRRYNMHVERIGNRLKRGWTPEEACKIPIGQKRKNDVILTYNGVSKRLSYYAKEFGIEFSTLRHRLNVGWTVENALTTPTKNIFTAFGEQANLSQFCEKFNISKISCAGKIKGRLGYRKGFNYTNKNCKNFYS